MHVITQNSADLQKSQHLKNENDKCIYECLIYCDAVVLHTTGDLDL